ncbi:MAG: potassium channel protein [Calditrichaeota bacterium]|nr:MAG: potassium channel protein [Calditrichota bacterium]
MRSFRAPLYSRVYRIAYRSRHRTPIFLLLFAVTFFALASFSMYHFEHDVDPTISPFDAMRIVLVYFLGEYGDTPKTYLGRVISVLTFLFGILVVATLIGKVTSLFVQFRWEVKMPEKLRDHIVICNWNERGDRIIKELHASIVEPDMQIIVVAKSHIDEEHLRHHPAYENVFFIKSDPTLHDVLERAKVQYARSVIILSDLENPDPDAKTALIALAISKLQRDANTRPHIVAEAQNHRKIQHLQDAGVDEWICSTDYGLGIMAQCALYSKLSTVYQQLLTYSEDTNEIYIIPPGQYPRSLIGKTFIEISDYFDDHRDQDNPVILIGIKREEAVLLNPRKHEFDTLRETDGLIVMSFERPKLETDGTA